MFVYFRVLSRNIVSLIIITKVVVEDTDELKTRHCAEFLHGVLMRDKI